MSARRGAVVVPAALVAAVILGVGVWAFFDGTGQGSAQATLATLSAPGNVTASSTAGTTTVSLIWGASTLSNGLAVDGYYATRTNTSTLVTSAACGTSSASLTTSTSCSDTSVPDGTYTYAVIALFRSWSATATSNSVTVISDITAPTQAISLTAATGAYLSGSTLYWNGTNTTTGSFKLADAVTDSGSGPASAAFPAIGAAGWAHAAETVTSGSGSAPTITYTSSTYSWGASAANPADQVITGRDAAGNTVTTTLHFTDDISGPTGGSVDASGLVGTGSRYSTSTTLSIAFGKGTDSGSGLATGAVLTRAQATLSSSDGQANGTCGSYGSFTTLATDPTSPYTDNAAGGVSTGHCYEYEYVVPDNVGNQTTYTSPDVKVQTSAPGSLTPIVSLSSATGNTFVTGTTAYIDPQTGKSGSFQTAATASDSVSGLQKVNFPALTGFTSGGGDVASPGPYETTYSWFGAGATASGSKTVTSTDNATYTGTGTFTVTADTTAPATSSSLSPSPNGAGWTAANTTVSLTATDDGSGVASITYSASGAQTIGSTVVSGSAAAPVISSEGTTTVSFFATDNVGNVEATKTVTVMLDKTSPTNSLSITAASGAFFSGGTLFYKGNAAGSFKLVDAVTDNTSGPASATFGAIATTGWTHNAETLSSGTGGAPTITYTSSTYSWTASPSNPAAQAIAAADIAGNSGTTGGGVSFASDTTAPSGGSVTVPAYVKTASVSVTFSAGSDGSGSGVNSASGQLLRASAAYTESTDTCGSFGSFSNVGSAGASSPFTDATVSTGNCYEYEYQVSDNVGNTATYGPSGTVKIDTTAPSVTAIASQESGGGAGDGQLQSGDKLVITFGDRLDPTTVPASGTGSESRKTTGATTTLTITGITSGAVSTGSTGYFAQSGSRTATFSYTAALSSNNTVVTVTITSLSGDTTAAGSGALAFTPANTIADPAGNTAAGTFTTASTFKLF